MTDRERGQDAQHRAQNAGFDAEAPKARFGHPLDAALLARHVARQAAVLDLGCGYGRLTAELVALGWRRAVGVDASDGMVRRGLADQPTLDLRQADARDLPFEPQSFGAVLAFTLFTSMPDPDAQACVLDEVQRILEPGGVLLVSDLPLQADPRNLARYRRDAQRAGVYGMFELDPGFWMRHHDDAWFEDLARRFELLEQREVEVATMRGNRALARQLLLRRR